MRTRIKKIALVAFATLVLGACGGGGNPIGTDPTYSPTKTATPPRTKTATPTRTTKPPPASTTQPPAPDGETHQIIAKNPPSYDPYDIFARSGDKVVFTNTDPQNKHSWTVGEIQEEPLVDSGQLSQGEKFTYVVALEPGKYAFYCTAVPYMQSGNFTIS